MSARTFLNSVLAVAILGLATVHAQAPSFDVASIKRNVSLANSSSQRNMPGGRINFTNQRLRQVISAAYGSVDIEVVGGPGWVDDDRWDIVAAPAMPDPSAPWRDMLKTLLADRFKLRAHVEQRERPVYLLMFVRPDRTLGPGIRPTKAECTIPGNCGSTDANTSGIRSGSLRGTARTMLQVGRSLTPYAERRVLDRTGLEGRYDFELKWDEDVSIFTAVQEQLGLKLQAERAPDDVVVIDSVERAVED